MKKYPKQVLSNPDMIKKYTSAGVSIDDLDTANDAIRKSVFIDFVVIPFIYLIQQPNNISPAPLLTPF